MVSFVAENPEAARRLVRAVLYRKAEYVEILTIARDDPRYMPCLEQILALTGAAARIALFWRPDGRVAVCARRGRGPRVVLDTNTETQCVYAPAARPADAAGTSKAPVSVAERNNSHDNMRRMLLNTFGGQTEDSQYVVQYRGELMSWQCAIMTVQADAERLDATLDNNISSDSDCSGSNNSDDDSDDDSDADSDRDSCSDANDDDNGSCSDDDNGDDDSADNDSDDNDDNSDDDDNDSCSDGDDNDSCGNTTTTIGDGKHSDDADINEFVAQLVQVAPACADKTPYSAKEILTLIGVDMLNHTVDRSLLDTGKSGALCFYMLSEDEMRAYVAAAKALP